MPDTEVWTIGRLLNWTTEYLAGRGSTSARLDTELLLAEACGCERIELYTTFDTPASDATRLTFRELVQRRAEGMPVAHLLGRRDFYSLTFHVTPAVLIPRPETELLVVTLLDLVSTRDGQGGAAASKLRIADVGTGSGILAVCAARHIASASVTAIDISDAALEVARRNAREHEVADRIEFFESDLFDSVPAAEPYDFILSNPPYVAENETELLSPEVRDYEPREALFAGPTGVEVIERLVPQAAERLAAGGALLLEISPMIEDRVAALFDGDAAWQRQATIKDLAGLPRVVVARKA
ncbi:MAG: peptide chain release factor N(5)-glutamine methyltransferase [Planctomycetota bacterium]|nr:MAG: peptide chain release factor N(5)-glutamine methyltransferase [Planctomycetota bacterium]REJ88718.1 MAG: peptide chain release factor N(5)-glutamine methyltransferase [Planctomycetota bacterium]